MSIAVKRVALSPRSRAATSSGSLACGECGVDSRGVMYATSLRDDDDVTRDAKECNLNITYYDAAPYQANVFK